MRPKREHLDARSGFTLVELLVVVAIIGILASLLMAALNRGVAEVRRLECLNRQRNLCLAMRMYADEHEFIPCEDSTRSGQVVQEVWPGVRGGILSDGRHPGTGDVWYNALPTVMNMRPAAAYYLPSERITFYHRNNPLQCPSARFPPEVRRPGSQSVFFSLAMNSQLIRYPHGPTIKFDSIIQRHPSRVILFLDNRLEGETKVHINQEDRDLGQPAATVNRFGARHRGHGNLGFVDGHVRTFRGDQVVETRSDSPVRAGQETPPETDIIWRVDSGN